ncbi:putative ribonuclease H-like domain-containing protein [Tanacetum coccineum]|uniref:Ribonuclease H-like domain-containing protein n=1 Tax=Tanacetum coccineum TaxID=301880 RepID=A0ABQ5AVG2_9ASTR
MTIAEYMEYEAELKKQSRRSARVSHLKNYERMDLKSSHHKKNIILEYPHYSYDAKIDTYYDLPPLLLCFQPVQPHTNYDHKPPYADVKSVMDSMVTYESEGEKKDMTSTLRKLLMNGSKRKSKNLRECEGANKVSKHPVSECRAIYANNDSSTKLHEESSMANVENTQDKEDVSSKILPYLGVSVNVIPKSMFEFLKLTHLKKTEILVEMADMKKKAPIGIVENVLVKIDKILFPSDFMVIDMLVERNETMILGRPFLATIHAEINVFCDNPSISGHYFILEY